MPMKLGKRPWIRKAHIAWLAVLGRPKRWLPRGRLPGWVAQTMMAGGLASLVLAVSASVWLSNARAASVWCDDGTVSGTGWVSRVTSYGDPACSGVTHYYAYDHYDTMTSGTVVNIYLDFERAWRCGTLVYYVSDGPGPGVNTSSRNTWINWIAGYTPTCLQQSDHYSHYYKSGVIDVWAYVSDQSS